MKITFHYVRHGETLFNVLGRMQGWCDSPLTERGIRQAEMAHDSLLSVPLNRAFSSTSERCVDTADYIRVMLCHITRYEKGCFYMILIQ